MSDAESVVEIGAEIDSAGSDLESDPVPFKKARFFDSTKAKNKAEASGLVSASEKKAKKLATGKKSSLPKGRKKQGSEPELDNTDVKNLLSELIAERSRVKTVLSGRRVGYIPIFI